MAGAGHQRGEETSPLADQLEPFVFGERGNAGYAGLVKIGAGADDAVGVRQQPATLAHPAAVSLPSARPRCKMRVSLGVNIATLVRGVRSRAKEEEHDAMRMQEIDIQDYARQLLDAHGDRAVAEAAQKACAFEKEGNKEEADTWRHIEGALLVMRGAHVT